MNRRTRNSTRWITASALALALPLLAACSGDTEQNPTPSESTPPTPSETATPTETERDPLTPPTFEEPQSEEQAAEDAKAAVIAFTEAQVPLQQAGDRDALEQYLGGDALKGWQEQFDTNEEFSLDFDGELSFAPNDAVTVSAGKGNEFSQATVTGCEDLTDYVVTPPDQDPLEIPGNGKQLYLYDLAYQDDTGVWMILSTYQMEGTC